MRSDLDHKAADRGEAICAATKARDRMKPVTVFVANERTKRQTVTDWWNNRAICQLMGLLGGDYRFTFWVGPQMQKVAATGPTPREAYRAAHRARRLAQYDVAALVRQVKSAPTRAELVSVQKQLDAERKISAQVAEMRAALEVALKEARAEVASLMNDRRQLIDTLEHRAEQDEQNIIDAARVKELRAELAAANDRIAELEAAQSKRDDARDSYTALPDRATTRKASDKTAPPTIKRHQEEAS
jgi:hypothetical protein